MKDDIDPNFFENLAEMYCKLYSIYGPNKLLIVMFAKFIDKKLNDEGDKGGKPKKLEAI